MRSVSLAPLIILSFLPNPLSAQTVSPPNSIASSAQAPTVRDVTIPEGNEFYIVTVDEITSKTANKDDVVAMKADEPVVIGNQVVIPKGAFVRASVADVKRAGHFGHAGTLSLKIE